MARLFIHQNRKAFLLCAFFVVAAVFVSVPFFVTAGAGELQPLYPGYPESFDEHGILQTVQEDQLVVSDSTLQILPSTSFHAPGGSVGRTGIPPGSRVGLILTKEGAVKSVWFLGEGDTATQEKKGGEDGKRKDELRFENGVWKN
ncbi:MAG: hypothetical protein Kow0089_02660 [Desulfobulbaceae bacterium]